jgi:hypothetical protein
MTTLGETLNTSVAKPLVLGVTKAGVTINADVFQRIRQNAPGIARTGVAGFLGVAAMTPIGGLILKNTLSGAGGGVGSDTASPAATTSTTPLLLAAAGVLLLIILRNR